MTTATVAVADAPLGVDDGSGAHDVRARLALRAALLIGAVAAMADATVVAVALGPLSSHFHQSLASSQAVIGIYLVTVTATLPLLGRIGDRVGRRRAYVAGFAVFAAGSALCALAPGYAALLAGRAVQAAGGGLLTSGSLALMAEHCGPRRAGRGIALIVTAQAIAGLGGPPVGGLLVLAFGWQSVFWVGIPIAAAGAALTLAAVPADRREGGALGVDALGAVGLGALLLGVGAGIGAAGGDGLGGVGSTGWLLLAAGGAALLLVAEPRAARPIADARLLRGRFGGAALAAFLSTGSLMSCFALIPFWLEEAHGARAAIAGLALVPPGIGIAVTSRRAGRLGDLGRTRAVTSAGMLLATAGLALAALAAWQELWPLLGAGLLVLGMGNGLFSSPNTAAAMSVAPRSALSSAAGLLSTARNAGVIAGLGATGAAYTAAAGAGPTSGADGVAALVFLVAAGLCLAVAGIALVAYRAPSRRPA